MTNSSTLWPIFFFSLLLAWISEYRYKGIRGRKCKTNSKGKDNLFFAILIITMALFVGLRTWCNDTTTYRQVYDYIIPMTGNPFLNIDWSLGDNPGYILLNVVIKRLGASSQTFFMILSFITNGIYIWFIRKYSTNFWLSFFLFWTMGVYLFTAAAIKQTTAVALSLIGIDCMLKNKKTAFVIWILLATTIHPYALMFLMVPILMHSPWSDKTYYFLIIFAFLGATMQSLIGTIVDITSMLGETYDASSFVGEGVNIFRLLVVWAPIGISFLAKDSMRVSQDKRYNLFMNLSMLNAEIMFVALFGTANYFARLANYFLIFQTISLPWVLQYFTKQSKKLLVFVIVVCYMLYFVFANVILTPFNSYFAKMTLWEYLLSLF